MFGDKREERIERILTVLACRSAGVSEDMLPIPQNYEEILDFGEEAVKDLKSKQEILKFDRNWCDLVEEEELRQKNALTIIFEKEKIRPQTQILQKMLQELKIVWSLMTVKREIQQLRVDLTRNMLMGLKKEMSIRLEKALTKEELKVKWTSIHHEMMGVVLDRRNIQKQMDLVRQKKRSMHLELLTVLRMMDLRKEIEKLREAIRKEAEDAIVEKNNEKKLDVIKSIEKNDICNQDYLDVPESEETETFIPRKLFLFNVETFKMDSKHDDEGTQECSSSNSKSEMIECTPTANERSNEPKKKTLKSKIQKFFRLKS
ncbi:uncharacterized protein LOC134250673 isoform X2 [Saccostrea cucullata]|uniref:uncharacterized protein LOC134250673 isoform X2 n=1 Tax=Saccostrea cuccullata TaxID=36930 RepID=UPI002ED27812